MEFSTFIRSQVKAPGQESYVPKQEVISVMWRMSWPDPFTLVNWRREAIGLLDSCSLLPPLPLVEDELGVVICLHFFLFFTHIHAKQGKLPLRRKELLWIRNYVYRESLSGELSNEVSFHFTLKFLHVSTLGEAGYREGIPKSNSPTEETFRWEGFPALRNFYSKSTGFYCLLGYVG